MLHVPTNPNHTENLRRKCIQASGHFLFKQSNFRLLIMYPHLSVIRVNVPCCTTVSLHLKVNRVTTLRSNVMIIKIQDLQKRTNKKKFSFHFVAPVLMVLHHVFCCDIVSGKYAVSWDNSGRAVGLVCNVLCAFDSESQRMWVSWVPLLHVENAAARLSQQTHHKTLKTKSPTITVVSFKQQFYFS